MLIMPSTKLKINLNITILVLFLLALVGCGSFSSSSLVNSDGIYNNNNENETKENNSKYYENYFKEKALEMNNDFVFSDSINLDSDFITSNGISYSTNKAAWGQIPDSKDYIVDYYSFNNRYFGYGYGYGYGYYDYMFPYYGFGYGYPGYSYYYNPMRNWYRYGWRFGYFPFYYDFYPFGYWNRNVYYGNKNRLSYMNPYRNPAYNRDINNVSYNDGRRGSSSNVVIYGDGKVGPKANGNVVREIKNYNAGRMNTKQGDEIIQGSTNNANFRSYKDFVKNNSSSSVTRGRVYDRPEMGVGISGSGSNPGTPNKVEKRRYYNNPSNYSNPRPSNSVQYNWGLGGRNKSSNSSAGQVRSYGNPGSSSSSSPSSRSSFSSGSFSRPSPAPSSSSVNSSSSGGRSSSVGSVGRGSR